MLCLPFLLPYIQGKLLDYLRQESQNPDIEIQEYTLYEEEETRLLHWLSIPKCVAYSFMLGWTTSKQ